MLLPVLVLFLAGLTALGFLTVVWRRRTMPSVLRAVLIIGASAIVFYVFWALVNVFKH